MKRWSSRSATNSPNSFRSPLTPNVHLFAKQAYWQAEHHRAEKEEIKRRADVLKRWARLVKGLQIRRRLQTQYQRPDTEANLHGDNCETDVKRTPTGKEIAIQVSNMDPESGSVLQGPYGIGTVEGSGSVAEVRHSRVASSPEMLHRAEVVPPSP